jgi:hypothetical protein
MVDKKNQMMLAAFSGVAPSAAGADGGSAALS